jgi:hypothetical protein
MPAYAEWAETYATLHRWAQIVGKVRLAQTPWTNHSWHVALYVTARGLTTGPVPHGTRTFEVAFDFEAGRLRIEASDGAAEALPLRAQSVAAFYRETLDALDRLGLAVAVHGSPNELEDATPFAEDEAHAAYDAGAVRRVWGALVQADRVFRQFRAQFVGKCSPVHLFWGALDLAVTRFSGRTAPPHPGGIPHLPDWVTREAYSHEVSSAGFWPGGPDHEALFYSYAYPEPDGFRDAAVRPEAASYDADLGEFVLPYDAVRRSDDPDATLLAFLEDTYAAAADAAGWDRPALERPADPRDVWAGGWRPAGGAG